MWLVSELRLRIVLLQFAVQGGFSDSEKPRRRELIAARFLERAHNGAAFEFIQGQEFVILRQPLSTSILQIRWQIAGMQDRSGTQGHGTLDGILELPDVPGPIVG